MHRRRFLAGASSLTIGLSGVLSGGLLAGCAGRQPWDQFTTSIDYPGRVSGHQLRDMGKNIKATSGLLGPTHRVKTCIVGAGVAGLTASWTLHEAGDHDQLVLAGPELYGNAAGLSLGGRRCPTGAHYLPLPSRESSHVRHILSKMDVLQDGIATDNPRYDERIVVHSPSDRLLRDGQWQAGLPVTTLADADSMAQQERFTQMIVNLASRKGNDSKRIFVVPIVLSSNDPQWLALDAFTFEAWLNRERFNAPSLRWYLDYCCRDEFGAGLQDVSAWAGLHYFCSRSGHASNAEDGAVLTWADGLCPIAQFLASAATARQQILGASAIHIQRSAAGLAPYVDVHAVQWDAQGKPIPMMIRAQRVIMATPLFVTARIDPEIKLAFTQVAQFLPPMRSWLMGNFQFARPLKEQEGQGLSWDNVVYQSKGLGYVNADHQAVRVDQSLGPILTTYCALADPKAQQSSQQTLQWLAQATPTQLLAMASQDLVAAYGERFWQHVVHAHITVRGHAMASPQPGFLSNNFIQQLRQETGTVSYAHADLSGYSVFEEAAWWGVRAAQLA